MKEKKKLKTVNLILLIISLFGLVSPKHGIEDLLVLGIEPNSGPVSGETRVMARLKVLDTKKISEHPYPKCRFGSKEMQVDATYVKCTPNPRKMNEPEAEFEDRTEICVQCGNTKPHAKGIIPFTVSLTGDFTDTINSIPYRYYVDPIVTKISPECGPQNGGTLVEVTGENFLNYDQNLRCSFGSREVKAKYISETKLVCKAPFSDVVQKKMPFAVSFNFQQKSKQDINYVYYEIPQIFSLEPPKGPDTGGTEIRLSGQNFNPFVELPDFFERNKIICRFDGIDDGLGVTVSSTYTNCTSPPAKGRIKTIPEVSLNGQDFHKNPQVAFYYYHPPYISSITPKSIAPKGGTEVTAIGTLCKENDDIKCYFKGIEVKGNYVSDTELNCLSPPIKKTGAVPFQVACKPGEMSASTILQCFDDPIVESIEPKTGPEHGHTQLRVKGKKFPAGFSEVIKCSFNQSILTEATVVDDENLYCFTPSVIDKDGVNTFNVSNYNLEVTMDEGKVFHGKKQKFEYYKQHYIKSISPNIGPVEGGTLVNIEGEDFSELKARNVSVRFATYNAEIVKIQKNLITVKAPKANQTGPVYVQLSFNGQQFDERNHNENNLFRYHKWPVVTQVDPEKGSTNAPNDLTLTGVNFIKAYDTPQKTEPFDKEKVDTIYYRFVDKSNNQVILPVQESKPDNNQNFRMVTPLVKDPKNTTFELSYNNKEWKRYDDLNYEFVKLPQIKSINPEFAPLSNAGKIKIAVQLEDYTCEKKECKKFKCRFKSSNSLFYTEGELYEKNKVSCDSPRVRNPEQFNLELSPESEKDVYTHSNKNFTYYAPYVMKVQPQMIASKGDTLMDIYGYGFANTGPNLKAQFGAKTKSDGFAINCNGAPCRKQAEYVDSQSIKIRSFPRSNVKVNSTNEALEYQRFPVEVSVYNDDFTTNNVTVFYFDEPSIIQDLDAFNDDNIYNAAEKEKLKPALVRNMPANTETFIPIPLDSNKIKDRYKELKPYMNCTCRYTMENTGIINIQNGILTSFPQGSEKWNLFLCETPNWGEVGNCQVQVSLNGYDYTVETYDMSFTDPLFIHQMNPTCGPNEGNTPMEFIGTGFRDEEEFYFKWGPQNIVPMRDQFLFEDATETEKNNLKLSTSQYKVKKMRVYSPPALHIKNTTGGPDYISLDRVNMIPLTELLAEYNMNSYKNQHLEYYYYHQLFIDSFSPKIADCTDPTLVTVFGAFFLDKPEYDVKPYCKFGDVEVEGTYKSNVRITCLSPEYPVPNVKVPFSVSLNGKDYVKAEEPFTFLAALKSAMFQKAIPQAGPVTGGTLLTLKAKGLGTLPSNKKEEQKEVEIPVPEIEVTQEVEPEPEAEDASKIQIVKHLEIPSRLRNLEEGVNEIKMRFVSKEDPSKKKDARAEVQKNNDGTSSIICITPDFWTKSVLTRIFVDFGSDFIDTEQDFYFYNLDEIFPRSGPFIGGGNISIDGGGFMNGGNTQINLDKTLLKSTGMDGNKVRFPLPPSKTPNYVGPVDLGLVMNGENQADAPEGFYYYEQINVSSYYPTTGPAKGKGKIIVSGDKFRSDFKGADPSCKFGNYYGKGEVLNNEEMVCNFEKLPVMRSKKKDATPEEKEEEEGYPLEVALNNYSFVQSNSKVKFKGYSINYIEPVSGPITGGTKILVHGTGFSDTGNIRCRFGTPGWYSITQAKFIDSETITCLSPEAPEQFKIPKPGQLPFNVPFDIAFTEDEYEPWTDTSHTFTFYKDPHLIKNWPKEGKTSEIKTVTVEADTNGTYSMPSALIFEDMYDVIGDNSTHKTSNRFRSQPIKCKYGRFGTTEATYINRTHLTCLTPVVSDDKNVGYEKVDLEVALNGQDYVKGKDVTYTFIGPGAGKMVWVYVLLILFIAILAIILILLATSIWGKKEDDSSQVRGKRIKYLIDENLQGQAEGNNPLPGANNF